MATKTKKAGRPRKEPLVQSDYLTVEELSDMIKLSKSHIYTLTSNKKIPHIKLLGKKVLFDKNQIQKWLESKTVATK